MDASNISTNPVLAKKSRIGFHYFPDTLHYTEHDLQKWLPELKAMQAAWLVLQSPVGRAIPDYFISGLIKAGIEPIIQFKIPLGDCLDISQLSPILTAYANWGVKNMIFFDRPNSRSVWSSVGWAQQDLVERFLDQFLPLADLVLKSGINPILPPLEPGGSYWDTAFLRSILESLAKRKQTQLLENLVIAAYGWNNFKSLDWGAGGPQRWPQAKPYLTPTNSQDQRSFRIFDWYNAITQAVLQKTCPIILLGAGAPFDPDALNTKEFPKEQHSINNLAIAKIISGEKVNDPANPEEWLEPVPDNVIACNFWLLSADVTSPYRKQAWFQDGNQNLPVVEAFRAWAGGLLEITKCQLAAPAPEVKSTPLPQTLRNPVRPINHYLLLPTYEWGIADWHLEVIRPFVKKYRPTVGFSLKEASMADHVTVIGNLQTFSEQTLNQLRQSGCKVDRIAGDGTTIASLLAER